jgi:hypothetical protein
MSIERLVVIESEHPVNRCNIKFRFMFSDILCGHSAIPMGVLSFRYVLHPLIHKVGRNLQNYFTFSYFQHFVIEQLEYQFE